MVCYNKSRIRIRSSKRANKCSLSGLCVHILDLLQSLEGLFVKAGIDAFSHQVIQANAKSICNGSPGKNSKEAIITDRRKVLLKRWPVGLIQRRRDSQPFPFSFSFARFVTTTTRLKL